MTQSITCASLDLTSASQTPLHRLNSERPLAVPTPASIAVLLLGASTSAASYQAFISLGDAPTSQCSDIWRSMRILATCLRPGPPPWFPLRPWRAPTLSPHGHGPSSPRSTWLFAITGTMLTFGSHGVRVRVVVKRMARQFCLLRLATVTWLVGIVIIVYGTCR